MLNKLTNSITKLVILTGILAAVLTVNYLEAAWTQPGSSPTGGNVDLPVNTGTVLQQKDGVLMVGALGAFGLGTINGGVRSSSFCDLSGNNCSSPSAIYNLTAGGGFLDTSATDQTKAGGLTVSGGLQSSSYCDESGWNCMTPGGQIDAWQINSNQYCDENGNNCTAAANLGVDTSNFIDTSWDAQTKDGSFTAGSLTSSGDVYANGRNYYFGSTQNLWGDNNSELRLNSAHDTVTSMNFRDAQGTSYGRVHGASDGQNFGLRDGDNEWSYLAIKDSETQFRINNDTKMIIDGNNVGIGEDNPRTRLDVDGHITIPRDSKFYLTRFNETSVGYNNVIWAYLSDPGGNITKFASRAGFYFVGDSNANAAGAKFVFGSRRNNPGYAHLTGFDELFVVNANGTAQSLGGFSTMSDSRLKTNVATIEDPLSKVESLRGVTFDWIDEKNHPEVHDMGLIAQEVQQVVPEVVNQDDEDFDGMLSVDYSRLTALLIEAVKELSAENDELEARITELEAKQQ